jgi:hypothetical protein
MMCKYLKRTMSNTLDFISIAALPGTHTHTYFLNVNSLDSRSPRCTGYSGATENYLHYERTIGDRETCAILQPATVKHFGRKGSSKAVSLCCLPQEERRQLLEKRVTARKSVLIQYTYFKELYIT